MHQRRGYQPIAAGARNNNVVSFGILALLDKGDSYDYLCPSLGCEQYLSLA